MSFRRRHDNDRVAATDAALRRVGAKWEADVDVKQRVADVVDIDKLDLRGDDRRYALQSHFDFVVWRGNVPCFAVEFDERHHFTDPAQLVRDERKNAICQRARLPLLRLEDSHLKRVGQTPVVEWLVDLYFVYHDQWLPARAGWEEAEGYNPDDWDDDLYEDVRHGGDEFSYRKFRSGQRESDGPPEFRAFAPLDPFQDARYDVTLRALSRVLDLPTAPWWGSAPLAGFLERDPQGRQVAHVGLAVAEGVVLGSARCWDPGPQFIPRALIGVEVAADLALQQLSDFLALYDRGRLIPIAWADVESQLAHLQPVAPGYAELSQADHRTISYRYLRRMGMPHLEAMRAADSLEWDESGRLLGDDH